MNNYIPGGRPRASSESDILDENLIENNNIITKTLDRKHFAKSYENNLCDASNSDEEEISSEKGYYTLQTKDKRRNKPLFKSVKKIWNRFRHTTQSQTDGDMSVVKSCEQTNKSLRNDVGTTSKHFSDSTSRPLITHQQILTLPWKVCPGTVGIQNHGNTCFMNAVLQCLSNTETFAGYFATKRHKQDLKNRGLSKKFSNSKSELTEQLGALLECLWSNNYSSDISSSFKSTAGKYNNQYKGSTQHDAQEFLLWLLDSVNEELVLTAVKKKQKSVKGKDTSDESLAEEVLSNSHGCHIYNMFQALYRSSLQCPDCHKQSNTFETYLCLSLPLPSKSKRPVFVTIVYLDGSQRQVRVGISIRIQDTVGDLRVTLADSMKIPTTQLVICQIYDDGFRCTYSDDQPISDISESEMIYALEMLPMPHSEQRHESPYLQLIVVHTVKQTAPTKFYRFSPPEVLKVARDVDYKMLQREILKHMADCIKDGLLSQKLDVLFRLRVVDGSSGKQYLSDDVEMPLLTPVIERALSMCRDEYGPPNIKLVAEWDLLVKERVIVNENNEVDEHSSYGQHRRSSQQPHKVSLKDCLQMFTREETLSGDDAWNCPHCHRQQHAATKTLGLWSLPDVLVIHLKRFRQFGERRNKLNTFVDFPVRNMDMADHILPRNSITLEQGQHVYDLYGVCNHYGNMLGGHYTAFCKNPLDEKWYEFDDSKVKEISETEVKTSSAYLLFYQKRGLNTHVLERLQDRTHWIFKLCPSLTNVNLLAEVKEKRPNQKDLLSIQNKENEGVEGVFSRQNSGRSDVSSKSDEKVLLINGSAAGHVSSKLVHNVPPSHTPSSTSSHPTMGHTLKPKKNVPEYSENYPNFNGDLKTDTVDGSYGSNLRVKLPPDAGIMVQDLKVDLSDKPARSNLYDRQNAYKPPPVSTKPPKAVPPVKTVSRNITLDNSNDIPPRPPRKDVGQPKTDSDLQRKMNYQYDDVDSRRPLTHSSPQQPKRQIHTNWSTPQPPRKSTSGNQSQTPFRRQNSIPGKRSSNYNPPFKRLSTSRSEEDIAAQAKAEERRQEDRRGQVEQNGSSQKNDFVIPSNKGVHEIINTYNTLSKKLVHSGDQTRQQVPSVDAFDGERHKKDMYRRSDSYQIAKNSVLHDEQFSQKKVSKFDDRVNEQKRVQKTVVSNYPQSQLNNFHEIPVPSVPSREFPVSSRENPVSSRDVSNKSQIPKSKTDDNLSYNTPHIHQVGSRKPVCEPSPSESSSLSDILPRYKPHKHHIYKPKEKSFRKEKMYSPCMKESSV